MRIPRTDRIWNADRGGEGLSAAGGQGSSAKSSDRIFFGCSSNRRFDGTEFSTTAVAQVVNETEVVLVSA